ncbi:MAG: biotin synthase BioB [Gemmataceae bacterium]
MRTGGCPEDCGCCPQNAPLRHTPPGGACPRASRRWGRRRRGPRASGRRGSAWAPPGATPPTAPPFERLEMVSEVRRLGMEACVTLGMLTDGQAQRLRDAGLTAYNHNLDTSRRYYPKVVTTRTYDERLRTLRAVGRAGISVCCGGIVGMGETEEDRLMLLAELSALDPPPESVPINCLVPVRGTPMADRPPVDSFELVRLVATTRIAFPRARVRLSAGRDRMSHELQALCFLAGANSVFFGEKLLTTPNPPAEADGELFRSLGLAPAVPAEP